MVSETKAKVTYMELLKEDLAIIRLVPEMENKQLFRGAL